MNIVTLFTRSACRFFFFFFLIQRRQPSWVFRDRPILGESLHREAIVAKLVLSLTARLSFPVDRGCASDIAHLCFDPSLFSGCNL